MTEIMGHGDRLTEMMNQDRLLHWNVNKELKQLKEEVKGLNEKELCLDELIKPVEWRFKWEAGEIEYWIEVVKSEAKNIEEMIS